MTRNRIPLHAVLAILLFHAAPVAAERLPLARPGDTGALREAMAEVGPGDDRTILLDGGTYEFLDSVERIDDFRCENATMPMITGGITVKGAGSELVGLDGGALPFCIKDTGSLTLSNVTVSGFDRAEHPYRAMFVSNEGSVKMANVTFHDNRSTTGILIFNDDTGHLEISRGRFMDNAGGEAILKGGGRMAVRDSVFADNTVSGRQTFSFDTAGVIRMGRRARADLINTTLTGNTTGISAVASDVALTHVTLVNNEFGLRVWDGALFLRNSILAGNESADCQIRPAANTIQGGVNLDGDGSCGLDPSRDLVAVDPRLSGLRFLDGQLPGREPLPGSPVLDRGDPEFCPLRDAVGRIRNTAADDDPRCALGAIEPPNEPPDFEIDARLTGTWYDPEHDGHYVSFQVLPINLVAAAWWTYDNQGNPFWLVGSGQVDGDTATIEVYASRGMTLPGLDDDDREQVLWGTLELEFQNCNETQLRWETNRPGFSDGQATLTRLTVVEGLGC